MDLFWIIGDSTGKDAEMLKLFDRVRITTSGKTGNIVEIDDDNGTKPPVYLVELEEKPDGASMKDVLIWCNWRELEKG